MTKDDGMSGLVHVTNFHTGLVTVEEQGRLLDIIKALGNGKNLKIENHSDALALCIKAKELNLPMGTALDHCFIVNGKVGIDVHIAKAKLLSSGAITWEKVDDYRAVFAYTDGVAIYSGLELPDNNVILHKLKGNDAVVNKLREEGKFPVTILVKDGKPIVKDYITTYRFIRHLRMIDGTISKLVELSSFTVSEAIAAGLIADDTSPSSPWIKYRKRMVDHRAFMNGARSIGDDLLLGMYSIPELLDSAGKTNYEVFDDGSVTILND